MFLQEINIIETSPCIADEKLFKAITVASVSLTELLPYLNAVVDKPDYRPNSNSLMFKKGIVGFTLKDSNINITRFTNMTELYEILDWIKDLINNIHDKQGAIKPSYNVRKIMPAIKIYVFLPGKNCKKCGENTCLAFAAKLSKFEAEIDGCPLLNQNEFAELKQKLVNELSG